MDTINSIGNAKQILREVSRVIVGKDEVMIKVLLGIVAVVLAITIVGGYPRRRQNDNGARLLQGARP